LLKLLKKPFPENHNFLIYYTLTNEIDKCIEVLNAGEIILYPTDTVWGLGCDATNEVAVKKIYALKQRSEYKSLNILVNNDAMLKKHVTEVSDLAWDLIDLTSSPTTIIFPNAKNLAKNVIATDGSIAIRMIKEGFCYQLMQKFRKPLVSTSANISNMPTPLTFNDISKEIISNVAYVVDASLDNGTHQPSALIKLGVNGEVEVLRK